jgi:L-amino acid N-acyltransferase YncA
MKEEIYTAQLMPEMVSAAVSMVRDSFNPLFLSTSIYRAPGMEHFLSYELTNPHSAYDYKVITNENDDFLGFCEFKKIEPTIVFLNIIALSERLKGKGVGNRILSESIADYRQSGYESMMLDVFSTNQSAISLYNRLGFIEAGKQKLYKLRRHIREGESPTEQELIFVNYPQIQSLCKAFGFGMLEYKKAGCQFRLGLIDRDLILHSYSSDEEATNARNIAAALKINNIFAFCEDYEPSNADLLDTILRMKIKL